MATEEGDSISPVMNNLKINGNHKPNGGTNEVECLENDWGFVAEDLYKIALKFYKDKEGKAIKLSYKDKLQLVALTKQVSYGKYRSDVSPEVGVLDFVGNDRRQAWQALGQLSREDAMHRFVQKLDGLCPLFKAYVEAQRAEREELERQRKEDEEREEREAEERSRQKAEEDAHLQHNDDRNNHAQQEMAIRAALNQQTAAQFRQYAEQQYAGNPQQQEVLIAQLQEQHFQQYMQQVYQQQLLHQQQQFQQLQAMASSDTQPPQQQQQGNHTAPPIGDLPLQSVPLLDDQRHLPTKEVLRTAMALPENGVPLPDGHVIPQGDDGGEEGEDDENGFPPIAAASMWNRKDLKEFKDSIRKDPDSIIKVGSGETVTVRVPTHEDGTCLFWEFATDSYDIGFGVYFEWTIAPSNQVSVHVSESSDEEDLEDEEGVAATETKSDVEKGGSSKKDNRPPTDEIIPVYRRDCHEEVYCGSHMYPGRGVYLLKFDNSYSLWRSKTLYYRVYYTR